MTVFRTQAVVTLDDTDRVLDALLTHMEEHATVIRSGDGARISSPFGSVDIARQAEDLHLDVTSGSAEILAMIKVFIAEHVFEFAGETASIVWNDSTGGAQTPPHFQKLVVVEAFDVTPRMRRVVLACENASAYAGNAGYHVRLLLPPRGRTPRWPVIAADGRMQWPGGKDTLVTRVYTIRSVDMASNRVAVDFVLHGSHACPGADFARQARPGDVVGMLGPGADGRPDARSLLLLGDEAALPAIARMLESLPAGCEATAFIEIEDEAEKQRIDSKAQVSLTWLCRRETGPDRLERRLADHLDSESARETYIWAGCEQHVAARLREMLRSHRPGDRSGHRIVGYWNRNA